MTVTPPTAPPPTAPPSYQPAGSYTPPATAPPPQKGSGCGKIALIGCSIIAVLCVIFVVGIVFVVFRVIKSSDVYQEARDRVAHDSRVIATIGSPVKDGFIVTGNVNIDNGKGTADFHFPVSGPKGSGRVHAVADCDGDKWTYSVLTVRVKDDGTIDVLH